MAERVPYTVSRLTAYISNMFRQDYLLGHVYVKGELSNVKYHHTGLLFFTLKDDACAMPGMMFASSVSRLHIKVRDGQQVLVTGSVRVFERDGKYQLYADDIRDDGAGRLAEQFEALKRELGEMGMFDQQYKKPIPKYIRKLGVVTSPTGDAVRDIINNSRKRNPGIQIFLYPAKVQGEGAAASIVRGIRILEQTDVDAIIIGRGGGSVEDLWAFNEESVARAVFACTKPIISAVGHENDYVISDFVADLRVSTPTAAADQVVMDVRELLMKLGERAARLGICMDGLLQDRRSALKAYRMRLELSSPSARIREQRHRLDQYLGNLSSGMQRLIDLRKQRVELLSQRLESLSPYQVLSNGYAFVTGEDGKRISSVAGLSVRDRLTLRFFDGEAAAEVTECRKRP